MSCEFRILCRIILLSLPLTFGTVSAQELVGLGDLPGGAYWSEPYGISKDGSTVVGWSNSDSGWQAFRWTVSEGLMPLGFLPGGTLSTANAVSDDGSVIAGSSRVPGPNFPQEAFRWTAETGMVAAGSLPDKSPFSQGLAISGNGQVLGGRSRMESNLTPTRWTMSGGVESIIPGGLNGDMGALSTDGSVAVGAALLEQTTEAFVWSESEGLTGAGFLPGGSWSALVCVSDDGRVAYGKSHSALGYRVVRWTASEGLVAVGNTAAGFHNGTVINDGDRYRAALVGDNQASSDWRAVLWDDENGLRQIEDVLTDEYGLDLGGWVLRRATAISGDGLTIVGEGTNPAGDPEAWLVRLPGPPGPMGIPAVSDWGLFATLLLTLVGATVLFKRATYGQITGQE